MGRGIAFLALVGLATGGVFYFNDPIVAHALAWVAGAVPLLVIGLILIACSLTKP